MRDDAAELSFARRVLHAEADAVRSVAANLGVEFHAACDVLERCAEAGGTVLVTGLGKSGLIGRKISATLASVGVPSHEVHPTEAAHGDLGRFRPQDCCLALSYSGETEEVVALAGILRQDGIPVITITRGGESSLARLGVVNLSIGRLDEAGDGSPPAPTCSTTATLALGDALALALARRRNFTNDDFARRHPGGTLGGLLRPVTEVLRFVVGRNVNPVAESVSVTEALARAEVVGRRPGALLLVSEDTGRLTGILTDGDLRRIVQRDLGLLSRPVREVMTAAPTSLPASALVRDAVHLVRESRLDEIPVVDAQGRPVGILDVQDLIAMKVVQG